MPLTKAEEKRAAILAKHEARDLAEREAREATREAQRGSAESPRTNWAASAPFGGARRRGRPPKPQE